MQALFEETLICEERITTSRKDTVRLTPIEIRFVQTKEKDHCDLTLKKKT